MIGAMDRAALAFIGWGALFVLLRPILEARLVTHVLVEYPLLLALGAVVGGGRCGASIQAWNRGGASGIVLAGAILTFWMVPRAIDTSVGSIDYALVKFVSLPVAGAALATSLPATPWLARQMLAVHAIAMATAMGWLYLVLPQRLCLRYPRNDQDEMGVALIILSVLAFVVWLVHFSTSSTAKREATSSSRSVRAAVQASVR